MAIEVLFCGVAHPEMKGAVERIFRTLAKDLIHELPGTTFSNPKERGDYPSEKLAAIDMAHARSPPGEVDRRRLSQHAAPRPER